MKTDNSNSIATDNMADAVTERLEHLRLIHFSILLVAGTITYLVFAGYSSAPELYNQLLKFKALSANLAAESPDLNSINKTWVEQNFSSTALGAFIGRNEFPSGCFRVLSKPAISQRTTIGELMLILEMPYQAEIEIVEGPVNPDELTEKRKSLQAHNLETHHEWIIAPTWLGKNRAELLVKRTSTANVDGKRYNRKLWTR